jgi:hypothetical protein
MSDGRTIDTFATRERGLPVSIWFRARICFFPRLFSSTVHSLATSSRWRVVVAQSERMQRLTTREHKQRCTLTHTALHNNNNTHTHTHTHTHTRTRTPSHLRTIAHSLRTSPPTQRSSFLKSSPAQSTRLNRYSAISATRLSVVALRPCVSALQDGALSWASQRQRR